MICVCEGVLVAVCVCVLCFVRFLFEVSVFRFCSEFVCSCL